MHVSLHYVPFQRARELDKKLEQFDEGKGATSERA